MLYLGSKLIVKDNSGAEIVKIINLRLKKTYVSSHLTSSSICLTVVKKDKGNSLTKKKYLKRKSLINVMIACVKKKTSRKNGLYLNFNSNVGIPFENKNKRLQVYATRVFTPVLKELKYNKKHKHFVLKAKKAL